QARSSDERRPLTVMDMAMPRDVEVDGKGLSQVVVHDLENVKRFVSERQKAREAAIPEAERLIARRLSEFNYWYDHARYELNYNGLEPAFEQICKEEMASALDHLPQEYRGEIAQAAERLARRLAQVSSRSNGKTRKPK
ncbi:MAG: hypothetical protein ACTSU0_04025, partial [Alphaproteobacteria bacterium]